ncbi:MAG TPA: SusD/RagB family nutrient-binding outer membrane lipoprotein, partial [Cyclobacteriaceae bacterium]
INYYQNVIKYTREVITKTKDDAARKNLYNMARIVQANAFMVLTDTYGDVPYDEAGKGYTDVILFPTYEAQQSVYTKVITELTDASGALDATATVEAADVLYNGNVAKWKKFGYSLLLRAGMRLVKADAAKAQATVAAAFAGGVIIANADNASNKHDANYVNPLGNTLNGTEAANFYLAQPLVNSLKTNNDPRLSSIAVRYVGAGSGASQTAAIATTSASNQYGLPVGSTDAQADAAGKLLPGGGARYAFSQLDRTRLAKRTSPLFLMTAAQTNLLLAEAAVRGWVSGTAAQYFSTGVKAHMDQMALYDAAATVAASDRDNYVAAHPLDVSTTAASIAQIGYEYWIASLLAPHEAWANFRRTGAPALAANPYSGRTVAFITRLTYPVSETLVNTANVQAAIAAQGPDALDTKVWWNK